MSIRAVVAGLGSCLPPGTVTNHDLAERLDTSDEWIRSRTGIAARRRADPGTTTADLAVAAGKAALLAADGQGAELVILATTTPDRRCPATAPEVAHRLGLGNAPAFDLSAVCSGFVYATAMADAVIRSGLYRGVLVIGAETYSRIIDPEDRDTAVIFGDGAGAVILEPAEDDSVGLIDFIHEVDGSGGCFLQMPGGGSLNPSTRETVDKKMHYVHQDGQQVFKFAVRKQTEACLKLLERNGLKGSDIDAFIPHQANLRIINATAERLGLRPESVIVNIDRYGNTTAGTIPLAMNTAIEQGKLKKGSLVLMASVGAGFTVGAALLRWAF